MLRQLGGVFGVAICAAVFAAHGGYASPAAFVSGFGPAMGACAGLALLGATAGLIIPRRRQPAAAVARLRRGPRARDPTRPIGAPTMHQDIIRYRTRPEQAAANEELIRAVYEELGKTQPDGLSYATFLLADQVTFLHLVRAGQGPSPLLAVRAFGEFQAGHRRPVRPAPRSVNS